MKDRSRMYELFQKSIAAAELSQDWELYVQASVEYGNSLLTDIKKDATKNGENAWPILRQAYSKALEIDDQQLRLFAARNLLIGTVMMLENLDSNAPKHRLALVAGDYVVENAQDDIDKLEAAGMQITILRNKLTDAARLNKAETIFLELISDIKPGALSDQALGNEAGHILEIAEAQKDNGNEYKKALKIAENLLQELSERPSVNVKKPSPGNAGLYSLCICLSRYYEIYGRDDLVIQYLQEAYETIMPVSPMDAVDIMTDLARKFWQGNRFDDALAQLEEGEGLLQYIWNNSAKMAIKDKVNAVRTDLLMVANYFSRHYEFGSQVALDAGKLEEAVAWREKGLVRFYKAVIQGELKQQKLENAGIMTAIQQLTMQQPNVLFLHFNSEGPKTTCIAWTKDQKMRKIELAAGLMQLVIQLKNTEYENTYGCWDDYEAWKRTASQGRLNRWLNIMALISEKTGEHIFAPVIRQFDCSGVTKLVVVMNGWMNGVPIQAAKIGNKYLTDLFSIVQVPSLMALSMLPANRGSGIRVIDGLHKDLPWAKAEIAATSAFFKKIGWPVKQNFPAANNKKNLFADLGKAGESVIHMATHMTYVQDRSAETAILFNYDGEIKKFKLTDILNERRLSVSPGTTVILSGCESSQVNFHRNRFLASISRAFLLSGAASVIGTAWIVDDIASYFLMNQLYREWERLSFKNLSEALRCSQNWLREQSAKLLVELIETEELKIIFVKRYPDLSVKPFINPFYWASWSYSGIIN